MSDTPTPRAVLARAIYDQSLRDCVADGVAMAPPFEQLPQNERDDLLRQADAALAALAASAGPLSAEELAELRANAVRSIRSIHHYGDPPDARLEADVDGDVESCLWGFDKLLTAYTALAADLAALRATMEVAQDAAVTAHAEARETHADVMALIPLARLGLYNIAYHPGARRYRVIDDHDNETPETIRARAILARTPTPEGQG